MTQDISTQFDKWLEQHDEPPKDKVQWMEYQKELKGLWQQLELQNFSLRQATMQDQLTGLLNYQSFCELAQTHIMNYPHMAFMMIDIDDFKGINTRYGHLAGNKLLSMLAKLLKQELPVSGLIGRFGGDEFLIAFPCSSHMVAKSYSVVLLDKIRQSWFSLENQRINLEVSIGLNLSRTGDSLTQILSDTDKALFEAKSLGKNQYFLFNPSLPKNSLGFV